jgi:hypothetical protein
VSNPITTTGVAGGPITTTYQSGQTTREWVDTHNAAVGSSTPSGNKLTTTWTSSAGAQEVITNRLQDESDAAFLARHQIDYLTGMTSAPPVP